ncbi:hypothetical protein [Burkholderia gladioli]|uniref:hypothetical protein n=1 Tax=Burkholderia gladioli TaxID=28095 RepID=UPI0038B37C0C
MAAHAITDINTHILNGRMDKFLNYSLIGVPLSLAIRFFWSSHTGVDFSDFSSLENWELYFYGASLLLAVIWFWNIAIRTRCPKCRSTNAAFLGEEEIDRWVGTKKVSEKLSNGQSTKRSVSTTFERVRLLYECVDCRHGWTSSPIKREKK